jgi:hypothetical protein
MSLDIKYFRYEVPVYYTVDSCSASEAALERASLSMGGDAAVGYLGRRYLFSWYVSVAVADSAALCMEWGWDLKSCRYLGQRGPRSVLSAGVAAGCRYSTCEAGEHQ